MVKSSYSGPSKAATSYGSKDSIAPRGISYAGKSAPLAYGGVKKSTYAGDVGSYKIKDGILSQIKLEPVTNARKGICRRTCIAYGTCTCRQL